VRFTNPKRQRGKQVTAALLREVFASLALRVSVFAVVFAVVSLPVTTVSQKWATSKLALRVGTKTIACKGEKVADRPDEGADLELI